MESNTILDVLHYNANGMNKVQYQNLSARMNQELLLVSLQTLDSLSYLLSIYTVFNNKDDWKEEDRLNENNEDTVFEVQSMLQPLLREAKSNSDGLHQILLESGIIPENLIKDIQTVLEFKEEATNPLDSALYPYLATTEDQKDACEEFLYRLVLLHRVESWIQDIADGILEYGVSFYQMPEDDSEKSINILQGMEEMDWKDCLKELPSYLLPKDGEDDERQLNKKYEATLLKDVLVFLGKEKKNDESK